jgi:hypothetical protein
MRFIVISIIEFADEKFAIINWKYFLNNQTFQTVKKALSCGSEVSDFKDVCL